MRLQSAFRLRLPKQPQLVSIPRTKARLTSPMNPARRRERRRALDRRRIPKIRHDPPTTSIQGRNKARKKAISWEKKR